VRELYFNTTLLRFFEAVLFGTAYKMLRHCRAAQTGFP
jgi:hypothetical protein